MSAGTTMAGCPAMARTSVMRHLLSGARMAAASPAPRSVAGASHLGSLSRMSPPAMGVRSLAASAAGAHGQDGLSGRNGLSPMGPNARGLSVVAKAVAAGEKKQKQKQQPPKKGGDAKAVEVEVVALPTSDEDDKMLRVRHTSAHVMAMALQRVFPKAQCTIGPWIEKGFFYDFDMSKQQEEGLTVQDLRKVKKEMVKIIKKDMPLTCETVSREEAEKRITAINEPYKLEILEGLQEPITIYHIGDEWWDLCAGPHVESTGKLNAEAIELESVAGAYWRGDETKAMLQRIYGTAWQNKKQLKYYQHLKEEAKRRDHRKLGQEMNLFSIQDEAGAGLVFWHPKGAMMRHMIESFWKEAHIEGGYDLIYSPHVAKVDLWKTSGHYDFYGENMFDQMQIEEESYQLKPMNCPFHIMVYKDGYFSYRDLPLRWAEMGTVYRYERSGTMHGLFRVRGFTQDDAHIFCLPDQITAEIKRVLDLTEEILTTFGFKEYEINLSTRPEKSVGSDDIWDKAEKALVEALDEKGWSYVVDNGGGAFYGPKIDLKILDAIGRKWQCSTIQLDFNLPERFELEYTATDSSRQRPIMIHRAIFGSVERFFGILTESYAGNFPVWIAPVQLQLLPVSDELRPYCDEVAAAMRKKGIRVEIAGGERLGKLIRNGEKAKVPVMGVVGRDEVDQKGLAIRTRGQNDLGFMTLEEVTDRLVKAVETRGEF